MRSTVHVPAARMRICHCSIAPLQGYGRQQASAHAAPVGTILAGQSKTGNRALEQRDHTQQLDKEKSISVRGIYI